MKKSRYVMLFAFFLLFIPYCSAGPWHGKVLDAETNQPIEGAAVVAVWNSRHMGFGDTTEHVSGVRETITDKNGEFVIPAYYYNPVFSNKNYPAFTIYKPGYGALPQYNVRKENLIDLMASFAKGGGVVLLPKMKTREERHNVLYDIGYITSLPRDKTKNFMRLYNLENKYLGFEELR